MAPSSNSRSTLSRLDLRCPPLPQTLVEAARLLDRPTAPSVQTVTDLVQRDPSAVARLLHVVNSAYYGLRHEVSSTERAVVMLGPTAVAGLITGMGLAKVQQVLAGPAARTYRRLIEHSVATAFIARHLSVGPPRLHEAPHRRRTATIDMAFTCGLLHDFGKIILVYTFPREASALYEGRSTQLPFTDAPPCEMEQLLFGCDHTEAGEYVARKLRLPQVITQVIRSHHEPDVLDRAAQDPVLALVLASNAAAKAFGFATEPHTLSWSACTRLPVWKHVVRSSPLSSASEMLDDLHDQAEHLQAYVQQLTRPVDTGDA
ncbi:MAG: HDOD domain-containing protein [Bacteroidota bacterium]